MSIVNRQWVLRPVKLVGFDVLRFMEIKSVLPVGQRPYGRHLVLR